MNFLKLFPKEKEIRLVWIVFIIVLLFSGSIVKPFLSNPYWLLGFDIAFPILLGYLLLLSLIYGIEEIKEEIWKKYQKELEDIKKK